LLKGAKYEFVGKKIKTNMESSREENQSIIPKEYIISWLKKLLEVESKHHIKRKYNIVVKKVT
jgi:hypothetical protein